MREYFKSFVTICRSFQHKDILKSLRVRRNLVNIESEFGCSYKILYDKNNFCELASLCDQYGSDKGELTNIGNPYSWPSHNYTDFYSGLFRHCRSGVLKVFECGLGTNSEFMRSSMGPLGKPGASLRVWKDFFPIADIYGADIDRSILFSEPRIKTGFMDQTEPASIHRFWHDFDVSDFDLMVDDGLHTFHAGTTLFENSINRLSVSGIYVIEDVKKEDIIRYMNYFKTKPYNVEYAFLSNTDSLRSDNNLVVIRNLADYHGVS